MLTILAALALVQQKSIVNDDQNVILQVIKMYQGNIFQTWNPDAKHRILLNSRFRSKTRSAFRAELDRLIEKDEPYSKKIHEVLDSPKYWIAGDPRESLESLKSEIDGLLHNLRLIQKDQPSTGKYAPPPIVPLKRMTWPSSIKLIDKPQPWTDPYLRGPDKYGYDDTYLSADPPSYSNDGKYVLVKMYATGDPEPLRIFAFFKRINNKWVLSVVYTRVY